MFFNPEVRRRLIERESSSTNCCITSTAMLCFGILVIFILALFYAFPVAMLIIATQSEHENTCNGFISPVTWMIVDGSVSLVFSTFVALWCISYLNLMYFGSEEMLIAMSVIIFVPFIIVTVFELVWLIIGSIMFWGQCIDLTPMSLNILYWIVLTLSWVMIFFGPCFSKKEEEKGITISFNF